MLDPPTNHQIAEVKKLRRVLGIGGKPLPKTKREATAELHKLREGRPDYVIRNRRAVKVNPEKQYAEQIQAEINRRHEELKAEFLAREAERRSQA